MRTHSYAQVREPAVSGQFYPAQASELDQMVEAFLSKVPPRQSSEVPIALIVPHAGYMFSGQVAAYAYKQIEGFNIQTVIVLGLAHSYPLKGAAIYPKGAFRTPIGDVPIDDETAAKLVQKSSDIEVNEAAHQGEHSIETQLPFLQHIAKNAKLVPVLMGNPDLDTARRIGEAVAEVVLENEKNGKHTLIIASTDMAHYPNEQYAIESDQSMLKSIEALDSESLLCETNRMMTKKIPELHCTLCGEGVTLAVMAAAKKLGVKKGVILKHATSADSPFGDSSRTVGYCAVAFFGDSKNVPPPSSSILGEGRGGGLSEEEQKKLLEIARSAITRYVTKKDKTSLAALEKNPVFSKPTAVFVTLMKEGNLRGCIGSIEPEHPLGVAVEKEAISAAAGDPRFSAVTEKELNQISIEISVLSPIRQVKSADEIVPFKDGVIVTKGARRGLFLPQVWEHVAGSKEKFMNLLCSEKAGLSEDAWKNPETSLSTFSVFAFDETKFQAKPK